MRGRRTCSGGNNNKHGFDLVSSIKLQSETLSLTIYDTFGVTRAVFLPSFFPLDQKSQSLFFSDRKASFFDQKGSELYSKSTVIRQVKSSFERDITRNMYVYKRYKRYEKTHAYEITEKLRTKINVKNFRLLKY